MEVTEDEQVPQKKNYDFTVNYFSGWFEQPQWRRLIKEFSGKPVHCLALGGNEGRSVVWLLENVCTHPNSKLTIIDTFDQPRPSLKCERETEKRESRLRSNIAATGKEDQVEIIKADMFNVLVGWHHNKIKSNVCPEFDFVYSNEYRSAKCALTETTLVWPLLKYEGIITFNDYILRQYSNREDSPHVGVNAFLISFGLETKILNSNNQLSIRKVEKKRIFTEIAWENVEGAKPY